MALVMKELKIYICGNILLGSGKSSFFKSFKTVISKDKLERESNIHGKELNKQYIELCVDEINNAPDNSSICIDRSFPEPSQIYTFLKELNEKINNGITLKITILLSQYTIDFEVLESQKYLLTIVNNLYNRAIADSHPLSNDFHTWMNILFMFLKNFYCKPNFDYNLELLKQGLTELFPNIQYKKLKLFRNESRYSDTNLEEIKNILNNIMNKYNPKFIKKPNEEINKLYNELYQISKNSCTQLVYKDFYEVISDIEHQIPFLQNPGKSELIHDILETGISDINFKLSKTYKKKLDIEKDKLIKWIDILTRNPSWNSSAILYAKYDIVNVQDLVKNISKIYMSNPNLREITKDINFKTEYHITMCPNFIEKIENILRLTLFCNDHDCPKLTMCRIDNILFTKDLIVATIQFPFEQTYKKAELLHITISVNGKVKPVESNNLLEELIENKVNLQNCDEFTSSKYGKVSIHHCEFEVELEKNIVLRDIPPRYK
jgi:hypothetical protein